MPYSRVAAKADAAAMHAGVALGFSIPLSVALDNVLLAIMLLGWLLGLRYREKLAAIGRNPVALLALALFALLAIGTLYGDGEPKEALRYLNKHADLVYLALLIPLFSEAKTRERAMQGFMVAMVLSLGWSYMISSGWAPESWLGMRESGDASAFKHRITHNLLMALAAFLFAFKARHARSTQWRLVFAALTLLALYNILAMVGGRTGYVVLGVLMVYFFFDWLRWKGLAWAAVAGVLLTLGAFYGSPAFNQRIVDGIDGYTQWDAGGGEANSVGIRLDYYRHTAHIISDHPWTGVGTGGFRDAYAKRIKGTDLVESDNPHNQYLLTTAQVGVAGLVALLALLAVQWRLTARLSDPFERHFARGVLITVIVGSLFNSLLLDHTEGLLYAWASGVLFAGLAAPAASGLRA